MSAHTSGPLSVWGRQETTEIGGFYMVGRADFANGPTAYVSNRDDAALYAAAPDLLRALKVANYAMDYVLDTAGDQLDAVERADISERREQARAAIAKASPSPAKATTGDAE